MLTDIGRFIVEVLEFVWPFRKVMAWERGVLYVNGKYRRTLEPGVYLILWWFMEIRTVDVVRDNWTTALQTITVRDGGTLTFAATASLEVFDVADAMNNVVNHSESAMEDVSAILADKLADLDVARLDPDRRRALLKTCIATLNETLGTYGTKVTALRFNHFIRDIRAYRLLGSQGIAQQ